MFWSSYFPEAITVTAKSKSQVQCCVAALCENGGALVMASDKMVGFGYVESEPDIKKIRPLHKDWWLQFAGDDITSVFDVVDFSKQYLVSKGLDNSSPATLRMIIDAVEYGLEQERSRDAANLYLPTGWTIDRFNTVGLTLPDFDQIKLKLDAYELPIKLLVSGFEGSDGYIFALTGSGKKRESAIGWTSLVTLQ